MTVLRKSIGLLAILVLFISSCMSIDTTVKIEPGFVGQKYKNICVMANYDVQIMQYDTEKSFCDALEDRSVRAVRGQELFDEAKYNLDDDLTIAVLKENNIEACVVITRGSSNSTMNYRMVIQEHDYGAVASDRSFINHAVEFFISVVDIKTGKILWSATSKTNCSGDYDTHVRKAIKAIAKDICKRLQRDDVIGR